MEKAKIENLNFILAVVKTRHLMENLKGFTYPTAAKCDEITIFDQKQPFET